MQKSKRPNYRQKSTSPWQRTPLLQEDNDRQSIVSHLSRQFESTKVSTADQRQNKELLVPITSQPSESIEQSTSLIGSISQVREYPQLSTVAESTHREEVRSNIRSSTISHEQYEGMDSTHQNLTVARDNQEEQLPQRLRSEVYLQVDGNLDACEINSSDSSPRPQVPGPLTDMDRETIARSARRHSESEVSCGSRASIRTTEHLESLYQQQAQ